MADLGMRSLGMMQALAGAYANGEMPHGSSRGIVDDRTALDSVMQLFAVLDSSLQAGDIAQDKALHGMSMLMLLREHLLPLPDPTGDELLLEQDLRELADGLAAVRQPQGPTDAPADP